MHAHRSTSVKDYDLEVNDEGLINQGFESGEGAGEEEAVQSDKVAIRTIQPTKKQEPLEKVQEGFNQLIEQLQGIKEHLNRQVAQHEDLMSRLEQLPTFLESFPASVDNQERITEQLKTIIAKDEQFVEAVERIPSETAKQTDALVNIDHQLAAAAETDVQVAENFNKFNEILDKLNQSTLAQTDGIMQMSKTFAVSDRYLKYLMSRQSSRFMWIFMTALGVCVLAISILTAIIIYLRQ
jgi:predicted nuclease with TOPRIM domain